jgi:fatty-acyl-CoA synthase
VDPSGTTSRRWITATTLGDLLDRRASEQPEREAVVFPDETTSYAQLAARAEYLARGLLGLGVQRGDPVGILLPNCVDALAALFGAAKIGALPVPINGRFKEFELSEILAHSGMRALLTSPPVSGSADFPNLLYEVLPSLPDQRGDRLALSKAPDLAHVVLLGGGYQPGFLSAAGFNEAAALVARARVAAHQQCVRVRDPAVIMYTSGTTAAPKGAMISHEALTRFADGTMHTRFFLTPDDRVWTALPLFHIGGIAFAAACVYAGCSYIHAGFFQPHTALDLLEAQRCTVALAAFETIWLGVLEQPDFAERDLSSIRIVMAVGVPERLRQMATFLPRAVQVSCFGQTEASSFLSLNYLDDTLEQRTSTGGHPMPGMQCRVADPETGLDQPPDVEGEMLYRGSNCFDGYFREPDLTARSFDDAGWFHTGDVATMDADGRVTFVSRLKDMLKVGGENVSAAEVEGYLLRHPDVSIVQVVAAPDEYYVEVPAAFIETKPGATVTEEEIIEFCRGQIASYRIPRYVRFVSEWPMAATKIKKYALRERIAAELDQRGITEAPRIHSTPSSPTRGQ